MSNDQAHFKLSAIRRALDEFAQKLPMGEAPEIYEFPHEPWKSKEMWLMKHDEFASATDSIANEFAEKLQWPRTTKVIRFYLRLRLKNAAEYLDRRPRPETGAPTCICTDPNVPAAEVTNVLAWLLIDLWHVQRREALADRYCGEW